MALDNKNNGLVPIRTLVPPEIKKKLEQEAEADRRKLSPMLRKILEQRYEE